MVITVVADQEQPSAHVRSNIDVDMRGRRHLRMTAATVLLINALVVACEPADNRGVEVTVRWAVKADQPHITAMVRRARLNPADLRWERFVIAERDGHPVGVAQLRRHVDGATELASLVVEPECRGRGVAIRMVEALLADEQAPVYTLIDRRFVDHFARWGFARVDPRQLPRSVSRVYRIGRVVTAVGSVLRRQRIQIVPLLRPAR
jgi:amino-acid N-acetyltransferase